MDGVHFYQIVVFVYKTIHPMHLRVFIHVEQGLCQNDAKATNSLHFIRTVAPVYEIAHSMGFCCASRLSGGRGASRYNPPC